jgi:hypothetical protein
MPTSRNKSALKEKLDLKENSNHKNKMATLFHKSTKGSLRIFSS